MRSRLVVAVVVFAAACSVGSQASAQEEKEWGYNKGFFFHTPQFELKISTRTQFRYTYSFFDDASASEDRGEFTLPRTRLRLDGYAYYPWLKYKVQYDFTGQTYTTTGTATRRGPDLRDLYFDLTKNPWTCVRLGQFKAPFGIQELTSSGEQEFVDRSIASEVFAPSRQQGAMLWGTSFEKKWGYEVGVFNGNSRNQPRNDNDKYLWAVRIHFDPNGEYKLSESAVDNPEQVNWTIGVAFQNNRTDAAGELDQNSGEFFFGLKFRRLFILLDQYARTLDQTAPAPRIDQSGSLVQVGFFLVPAKIELALRYSEVDEDRDVPDDKEKEARIGFGYYFSKHELKFQSDYGRVRDEASLTDRDTDVFRAQLQIVF